jgi:hypothetical protein
MKAYEDSDNVFTMEHIAGLKTGMKQASLIRPQSIGNTFPS